MCGINIPLLLLKGHRDLPQGTEVVSGGAGLHTNLLEELRAKHRHPHMSTSVSGGEQSGEGFHTMGNANSTQCWLSSWPLEGFLGFWWQISFSSFLPHLKT